MRRDPHGTRARLTLSGFPLRSDFEVLPESELPRAPLPPVDDAEGTGYGAKFDEALKLAADAHRRQKRKGGEVPYIGHLLGVCALVIEEGGGETEAIAALLHDVVEDQGGGDRLEEVQDIFGADVARIVEACSDRIDEADSLDWEPRKKHYLEHLEDQPGDVLLVSLADKLYNARAILRDHRLVRRRPLGTLQRGPRADALVLPRAQRRVQPAATRVPDDRELAAVVEDLERESLDES